MPEIFLFPGRTEGDINNVHRSSCKVIVIVRVLKKPDFFGHNFEKSSNTKFHENLSSGCRVVPCGQTDVQIEEANRYSNLPFYLIQLFPTHDEFGMLSLDI
jgi:hypothetical protein